MLNNLKINHKLILLVALPLLLLLILAVNNIRSEWHKLQVAQHSQELQSYISIVVALVHELQLERGISAGYLASKGTKFEKQLQQQRVLTDSQVHLLRKHIAVEKSQQHENHGGLQAKLVQLSRVRSAIDELNPDSDYFQYYSRINVSALEHMQRLNAGEHNMHLDQDFRAYTNLLWLQENAGQERAALTALFASGRFDLKSVQQLQGFDAKHKYLLRDFRHVIATPGQRELLDNILDDPAVKRTEEMQQAILNKVKKADLQGELQQLIGYGGVIHDFKNYVLRDSAKNKQHFVENFNKAKAISQEYLQLAGVSDTEKSDLEIIMFAMQKYRDHLDGIAKMNLNGLNAREIDRFVKVDDVPALNAIERLQRNAYAIEASQWFDDATERIELIKAVSDTIAIDINWDVAQFIQQANKRFITLTVLTVLVLIASLIIAGLMAKRLVYGVSEVSDALLRVKDSGYFDEHIKIDGKDEIGIMASSFNELITERKQIEKALEISRKRLEEAKEIAEKANQAKSEFLARMSHELRTPMNAILGFGQLMEFDKELSPERKGDVHEILVAGKHLLELINDVLDLTKIEANRIDVVNKPVSCQEILDEVITMMMPLAEQRHITVNYESSQCKDVLLHADPTRLKEVLLNLLSNAVKYNSMGGKITINSEPAAEKCWRINISDTGEGLSNEEQQRLFQPFERLSAENSEVEGTGIGLVISKRIIELMGGSIGVNSVPGQGSNFWFELNSVDPNAVEAIVNEDLNTQYLLQEDRSDQKALNILYVEDNPSNIRLVEHLISEHTDIPLLIAMTGQKGLELAATNKPDLILLDINLPDMNGFEILKEIRKLDGHHKTPIIAVSANAMPQNIEQAFEAGFSDYIAKPINLTSFFAVLNQFLVDKKGIRTTPLTGL